MGGWLPIIISASRRTDLPAFFSRWFIQRIREGYCTVANPFNPNQVSRVSLLPGDVDVIVFWTKDPRPLIPYLAEIDERGYRYYFQFTLNGYGEVWEPQAPPLEVAIAAFRELDRIVGPERVIWRYDPIVISNVTDEEYHIQRFAWIAAQLAASTARVVVSVVDDYRQTVSQFKRLARQGIEVKTGISTPGLANLLRELVRIAFQHGLEIKSCGEGLDWVPYGVLPGGCIDADYIRRVFGLDLHLPKDKGQRPECGCVQSKDIGAYGTCRHGCVYCYAGSLTTAQRNRARHHWDSPGILG